MNDHYIKFLDDLLYMNLEEKIDDLVYPLMNEEQRKEYHRLTSYRRLVKDCLDNGVEFSWQTVHDRGWTCRDSYNIFPELAGYDPNEYLKKKDLARKNKCEPSSPAPENSPTTP